MKAQTRAATYADQWVERHQEFARLVESLSDEQWQLVGKNYPQRLNEEDENRSVGVIAHHVAANEQFIVDRIYLMIEGKPLRQMDFHEINARHGAQHVAVTRDEVLSLLRANEERIQARVRAISDDALDVVHETPVGPATVAQRLERVLIGHMETHRGSIEAALS
jgi:ABC-type multidrug transport system ATPase subunit